MRNRSCLNKLKRRTIRKMKRIRKAKMATVIFKDPLLKTKMTKKTRISHNRNQTLIREIVYCHLGHFSELMTRVLMKMKNWEPFLSKKLTIVPISHLSKTTKLLIRIIAKLRITKIRTVTRSDKLTREELFER